MIRTALLSVSDKNGIVPFAKALHEQGIKLISTGGTAKLLADNQLPVVEVASLTKFPEMLDGRVKTLHPMVHGGLLARRDFPEHMAALKEHGIDTIDMLVINLYPFNETVAKENCSFEEAVENIDIGGPAMLRAAAKNHQDVTVLISPEDYAPVLAEMKANKNSVSYKTNLSLAKKVFAHTARYDGAIANYLSALGDDLDHKARSAYPETLHLAFEKVQEMRYGENPHQSAAFYKDISPVSGALANYKQLQGKELSYNNIADADSAWECVKSFTGNVDDAAACVIIKHANPCGVAVGATALEAYQKAFKTDPSSAFGGLIAFNIPCDGAAAEAISKQFVEVLIAPSFSLLVQSPDAKNVLQSEMRVVSQRQPTSSEMNDMMFAWRVAKFVKSNAIVYCANGITLGIGAGQMSRVDSARMASIKAENAGLSLKGSAVASDAFFPFRDGLDVVVNGGASCAIQPGGSMRDDEIIAAANEHGIAMVFTGIRHFRH